MRRLLVLWPLIGSLFAAGAAWAGVRTGLEGKVDKTDFAAHVQQTALSVERLRIADSLQQAAATEDRQRLRDIVCEAMKRPSCR